MPLVLCLGGKSCRVASTNELPSGGWNPEPQGSPKTLDASLPHIPAFLTQHGRDAAVAVSLMLLTEFYNPLNKALLPRAWQ